MKFDKNFIIHTDSWRSLRYQSDQAWSILHNKKFPFWQFKLRYGRNIHKIIQRKIRIYTKLKINKHFTKQSTIVQTITIDSASSKTQTSEVAVEDRQKFCKKTWCRLAAMSIKCDGITCESVSRTELPASSSGIKYWEPQRCVT